MITGKIHFLIIHRYFSPANLTWQEILPDPKSDYWFPDLVTKTHQSGCTKGFLYNHRMPSHLITLLSPVFSTESLNGLWKSILFPEEKKKKILPELQMASISAGLIKEVGEHNNSYAQTEILKKKYVYVFVHICIM